MSSELSVQIDQGSSIPLAAQICQQLSWLIVAGVLNEGDELPPVQELADQLGINIHTVRAGYQQLAARHVVSLGRGRRARVLGFDRTKVPESADRVPTHAIGVVVPGFSPFYTALLAGVEARAATQPALVSVVNAREDPDTALRYLDRLIARGVDGAIVAAALIDPGANLPSPGKPPIVFVDAPGAPGPSIEFDLERSQYLATNHLIEHGHRKIGYITPSLDLSNVAPKHSGHVRALQEAGLEIDPGLTVETRNFRTEAGHEATRRLLERTDRPSAIAAASDALAFGVYRAAHEDGVPIPDELAVVGNDNTDFAAMIEPNLTTVALPATKAGELAVDIIQQMRTGRPHADRVVLDVEPIIRNSCGCDTPDHRLGQG